ncbi:MAG: 23S rRNA pseudouridine synthase F, partial [Clostridiales bacterium]|nr:23S rRNA pseudouridine synthase F [Clostridiales bacterium]
MRINKYLADAGAASRRTADNLITEGRVKVNGKPAVIGQEVRLPNDTVTLDGVKLVLKNKNNYLLF